MLLEKKQQCLPLYIFLLACGQGWVEFKIKKFKLAKDLIPFHKDNWIRICESNGYIIRYNYDFPSYPKGQ